MRPAVLIRRAVPVGGSSWTRSGGLLAAGEPQTAVLDEPEGRARMWTTERGT